MAKVESRFLGLPLELRHQIYEASSQRPTGARLILKEYLEKIDSDIPRLPAIGNAQSGGVADGDVASGQDEDHDEDSEGDDDDEAMTDNEDEAEDDHGEEALEHMDEDQGEEDNVDDEDVDEDEDADEDEDEDDEEDESDEDEDEDEASDATVTRNSHNGRNTKYRHILPIINLDSCPPPRGLLGTCRQVNSEAINYFRDKCVLTLDVNKGFQHISMFVETIQKLIDAPFSPLEHMRKIHLIVTFDSEWLREKTTLPNAEVQPDQKWFFSYYFGERIQTTCNLIKQCPELRKITIDYYDTEDTPDSRTLMNEKLSDIHLVIAEKFYIDDKDNVQAVDIQVNEHFTAPATAHARHSPLALRRTEFDRFLQSGMVMH